MTKRRKVELVDLAEWPKGPAFDWNLCALCQTCTSQPLISATAAGCSSLAESLKAFSDYGALPSSVRIHHMDDGIGLMETLNKNGAKYHKMCRNSYGSLQLS